MNDLELERYSRAMMLDAWGAEAQLKLKQARILVLGAGGLGGPVLQILAAAGVGSITIVDDDCVERSNLGRQILFDETSIGVKKAQASAEKLRVLNPHIDIEWYDQRVDYAWLKGKVADYHLVILGTDTYESRVDLNQACVEQQVSWINGGAVGFSGQLALFEPGYGCLACLAMPAANLSCARSGVYTPLVFEVASQMANLALLQLTQAAANYRQQFRLYEAKTGTWQILRYKPLSHCPVCAKNEND